MANGIVLYSTMLFSTGVLFGYYMIAPLSVRFLGSYKVSELVPNNIDLSSYISTMTSVTLASGVVFQLPIVVYFLSRIGLVTPKLLKKYRGNISQAARSSGMHRPNLIKKLKALGLSSDDFRAHK